MTREVSLAVVCEEAFLITVRRYNQMAKEGLVPAAKNGQIDWLLSSRAVISFYQKKAKSQGGSYDDVRVRETTLKADLLEIELAEKNGDLLPFSQVKADWLRYCGSVKSRLLNLPSKYAPVCFGKTIPEIKEIIEGGVHQALRELSQLRYDGKSETMAGDKQSIHPAVKTDGKRMGGRRKGVKSRVKRGAG